MKIPNIARYLPQMDEIALLFVDRIAELQSLHGEMPANFQDELYRWALESVGVVALDTRFGCLDSGLSENSDQIKLIKAVNQLFQDLNDAQMGFKMWRFFPTPAFRRLQRSQEVFLSLVDPKIMEAAKHLESKISDDSSELSLMEKLLNTPGLSTKDVVTMIVDMFFAGIDTTAHTVAFTLYLLAKNPRAQVALQEELDRVLGNERKPLTMDDLSQMSYLKAVVKESFRVFPLVLGSGRVLEEDAMMGGYLVPKGYTVLILNMVASQDESHFKRPKEFLPERWLRDKPLGHISPFASLPFSHGLRVCVGRRIAEQEMYTLLARVMHRFNIEYKYGELDVRTRLVFTPSKPLKFSFSERR